MGRPFRLASVGTAGELAAAHKVRGWLGKAGYVPKLQAFSYVRRGVTRCPAKEDNEHFFCICNGLCSAAGCDADEEEPLYTAGTSAARVDRILPVAGPMAELAGARQALPSFGMSDITESRGAAYWAADVSPSARSAAVLGCAAAE